MPDVTIATEQLIDGFIADTLAKQFRPDPSLDEQTSRIVSVFSSLSRKDGFILQHAVERALLLAPQLHVWQEPEFEISHAADHLAKEDNVETCLRTELPYGLNAIRRISRDLIVVNPETRKAGSYDVKRGVGAVDCGKRRQLICDTLGTQMLLKDYVRGHGYEVDRAEARVISVYGRTGLPADITIRGDQLNEHFGAEIEAPVREAAHMFRARIADLLPQFGFRRV